MKITAFAVAASMFAATSAMALDLGGGLSLGTEIDASYDFDADGNETTLDYYKLLSIVKEAGYNGFIGVEYEGHRLSEQEGILATKKLLENVASKL